MKAFFGFAIVSFSIVIALGPAAYAQRVGTCPIFPSNNPWNVRVDTLPVDVAHSAAYIASVGGTIHIHPDFGSDTDYGIPWVAVNSSQPFVAVNDSNGYPDESDPGPMPIPLNAEIEHDDDSHVLVVDTSNHRLYELYQGAPEQANHGWSATSTAIFALDSNNYRPDGWTSCDAAGLPIFPGLVRLDECKAGAINHALRFTIPRSQAAWIFPGRHKASSITDTTYMPMGTRLRLKANFDDTNYTGYAKVISTALKKYGIILADNGSAWYISGEWNPNWPDDDISQLKAITGNDFEVVNTGYPIETSSKEAPTPIIPLPILNQGPAIAIAGLVRDTSRVGASNAVPISIANAGSDTLSIGRYWLKFGTIFQIADSNAHTIAVGGNAFLNINFSPIQHGAVTDTLFIASNANPSITAVALVGFGT
ncbi:MAG TPA: hypothetical protein VGM92_07540, partial [Candidatus Kapabacteria bacterium]